MQCRLQPRLLLHDPPLLNPDIIVVRLTVR